jgi:hypothetical protein
LPSYNGKFFFQSKPFFIKINFRYSFILLYLDLSSEIGNSSFQIEDLSSQIECYSLICFKHQNVLLINYEELYRLMLMDDTADFKKFILNLVF